MVLCSSCFFWCFSHKGLIFRKKLRVFVLVVICFVSLSRFDFLGFCSLCILFWNMVLTVFVVFLSFEVCIFEICPFLLVVKA